LQPIYCTVDKRPEATIVQVHGELDMAGAPKLREVLLEVVGTEPSAHVIVDLSDVGFIDSTAIGVIVGAHKRITAGEGRFTAVVTTTPVRKALQVTGLLRTWRVTGSLEDALDDV
jgi:anti-sigma B factor antagonist